MKREKIQPDYLTESEQTKKLHIKYIYELFQIILLFTGILLSLSDLMYSPACFVIAFISGVVVLIVRFLAQSSMIWSKRTDLLLYLTGLIALILSNMSFIQAIFDVFNRAIILCNLRFDTDFGKFLVKNTASAGSIFLWLLVGGIIASSFYHQMKKRQLYFIFPMIIICLMFGFIFGTSSMLFSTLCIILGIFGIFIYDCAPERIYGIHFLSILLGNFLIIIISLSLFSNFTSIRLIEDFKQSVSEEVDKIRYGTDTLPKGDLSKSSHLLDGNKQRLEIDIDQPQELYLKGFIGGSYKKDRWLPLTSDHYDGKYEGILKWLSSKKLNLLTQYSSYQKLSLQQEKSDIALSKVNVKNVNAYRKYVYLPSTVESYHAFGSSQKKDWSIQSKRIFGTSDYQFRTFFYSQDLTFSSVQSWMNNPKTVEQKNYIDNESVYDQFVKDSYLDIDASLKTELKNIFFKDVKTTNFNDVTTRIRQVLRQQIDYTDRPSDFKGQQDYISWLLHNSKDGNAVSYTTIAVMAYRSLGYPARYVEGYHLSKNDVDKMIKEEQKKIILTTKNAHAWVEIYRTGMGWIPVEVVPGMYTETYSDQKVHGKPSYQLKSQKDKSGINTEQGSSGNKETKKNKDRKKSSTAIILNKICTTIILFLYIVLIFYLILELQRKIRLSLWKKNQKEQLSVNDLTKMLGQLWRLSKVTGDYSHPLQLEAEILSIYPEIYPMEYERVVSLIQKTRFGGKKLTPNEEHTLKYFIHKISHLLWNRSHIFDKLKLRYIYIIPKE